MAKVHITQAVPNFYCWYLYPKDKDYIKQSYIPSETIELGLGRYIVKAANQRGETVAEKDFIITKSTKEFCVILAPKTE